MNFNTNFMYNITKQGIAKVMLLVAACLALLTTNLHAQCSPDITPPDITCPADITTSVPIGTCSAVVAVSDPVYSDNCAGMVTLSSTLPPGNEFQLGTNLVYFTATDASANSATCLMEVLVSGGISPAVCKDQDTVFANVSGATIYDPFSLLEGGPYNCSTIMGSLNFNGPATPNVTLTGTGDKTVYVWVSMPGNIWNKCWGIVHVKPADCSMDVTPPEVPCDQFYLIETNVNGPNTTILNAEVLDEGSTDNCTPAASLDFRISLTSLPEPPAETSIPVTGTGVFDVYLYVVDASGNWGVCSKPLVVTDPNCTPDVTFPQLDAPADMTISSEELDSYGIDFFDPIPHQASIYAAFGEPVHWDNCSNGNSTIQESYYLLQYPDGSWKRIQRRFFVTDAAGNLTEGVQYIDVYPGYTMHIPGWRLPPDTTTDTLTYNGNTLLATYSDLVFDADCTGERSKIERTWTIIDWNLTGGQPAVFPALDIDNDGVTGDPYDVKAIGDSIWLMNGATPVQSLVKRSSLYTYEQLIRFNYLDTATVYVTGVVYVDSTINCSYETGEPLLAGWKVKAIGSPSNRMYETTTDTNGIYTLNICNDDTSIEISLDVPFNYAGNCASVFNVPVQAGMPAVQNIAVQLSDSCNVMSVDITTPAMRPCFSGHYWVSYCNYSVNLIEGTYVDVTLDSLIDFTSSTIPGNMLSGNTFRFETGDLEAGGCGKFKINYILDCDAEIGATYCSEAHIFPEDPCGWNGPLIVASAQCEQNNVVLQIKNVGTADMPTALEFVVAEDLIMYMYNPFQLNSGEDTIIHVPANGSTWRISAPQPAGYPWGGDAVAVSEGCGGINTLGLVNQMPVSSNNPFTATNCTEASASFDPNDKKAFPSGVGNEHFIRQNVDIEYLIRFQNTGTDTAFTVVIYDTLSPLLNVLSVRPGASSHDYDFDILENNIMRFRFDHILLPDSNTNEAASHGFVKFRVQQQLDNPLDEVIYNQAAIVFDFNDPIFTNTTWHTIGKDFLEVNATDPGKNYGRLLAYPNPSNGVLYLEMPELVQHATFDLTDQMGKTVASKTFSGKTFRFEHTGLPPGIYFFRVTDERGAVYTGKMSLK